MKKLFLICMSILFINMAYAAKQYTYTDVYWNQSSETNNRWIVELTKYTGKYAEYGLYSLNSSPKNWILDTNYWKLSEGDNAMIINSDLGFYVKSSNGKYNYSVGRWYNVFEYSTPYSVDVTNGGWNNSLDANITFREASPTGQPLPGVLTTMLVGGAVTSSMCFFRRKKKQELDV